MTREQEPREISEPIGQAIRATAAQVQAPPELRTRLERQRTAGPPHRRRRPLLAAAGALVAVLAAVLVLTGVTAGGDEPTVAGAATAALAAPGEQVPAPATDDPRYVDRMVGGVRFPSYGKGWTAVGARVGHLGDRPVTTVTYGAPGARVGYAIVAGQPLSWPDGELRTTPGGTPVVAFHRDGALAVAWRRGGHTCVVASRDTTLPELMEFVDEPA